MKTNTVFEYPLFALGFRAFFFCAGVSALVLIVVWKAILAGSLVMENYYPATLWHGHEMLLGYSTAVIAGFLLTAVQNWTGKATTNVGQLAFLCLLWSYGRILPFYSGLIPDGLIALVDFAFLPLLAYRIGKPIIQNRQYVNLLFVGLLILMMLGNALIHAEILQWTIQTSWSGIYLVLGIVIVMILVIAGRVFPFFTERGLPGTLAIRDPLLDKLCIGAAASMFLLQIFQITGLILALVAGLAAVVNCMRWFNWYIQRIWYVPLLWILYTGYAWIIFGFVLTGLSAFSLVMSGLALHAFTMGGIGVLTLGMMSRVALGHTGRALRVSQVITIGFIVINLAVFIRVLLPVTFADWYHSIIVISSALWLVAFCLFAFVYLPILTSPRIDGKPG
jgi:uncharacterized protein involved in response to NO